MLCLDTYALVEISRSNPKFSKYLTAEFLLTDITLAEFYSVLLREFGEPTADKWFAKLSPYSKQASKEMLIEAVKFKRKNLKKNLSFFDAVGYVFAIQNNCKFVTGYKEFEGMPGVDFIKA